MTKIKTKLKKNEIEEVFKTIASEPSHVELNYTNHYTLLVAVVLSARATDKGVNKATENLFKIISTPEEMIALGLEKLMEHTKTIGLYKNKSKNIIELSKILVEKFNSTVPDVLEDLESLPGVGRKTANVILNEAFEQVTYPVDTHVFRTCNRIGITVDSKRPEQTEAALKELVPEEYGLYAAHSLVLHGRYTCKALKPMCGKCPISHICKYKDKKL